MLFRLIANPPPEIAHQAGLSIREVQHPTGLPIFQSSVPHIDSHTANYMIENNRLLETTSAY